MPQTQHKRLAKKKWAVCKADGPIALYAEHLVKRLRRHFFQVEWEFYDDDTIRLIAPPRFPPLGYDIIDVIKLAIRNLNADLRVDASFFAGFLIRLDSPCYINGKGVLKKVKK